MIQVTVMSMVQILSSMLILEPGGTPYLKRQGCASSMFKVGVIRYICTFPKIKGHSVQNWNKNSGVATGGHGGQSATPDSEKFAKIGKKRGKSGKIGKKSQKSGRFFHFAPPDR